MVIVDLVTGVFIIDGLFFVKTELNGKQFKDNSKNVEK